MGERGKEPPSAARPPTPHVALLDISSVFVGSDPKEFSALLDVIGEALAKVIAANDEVRELTCRK